MKWWQFSLSYIYNLHVAFEFIRLLMNTRKAEQYWNACLIRRGRILMEWYTFMIEWWESNGDTIACVHVNDTKTYRLGEYYCLYESNHLINISYEIGADTKYDMTNTKKKQTMFSFSYCKPNQIPIGLYCAPKNNTRINLYGNNKSYINLKIYLLILWIYYLT